MSCALPYFAKYAFCRALIALFKATFAPSARNVASGSTACPEGDKAESPSRRMIVAKGRLLCWEAMNKT